MNRLPLITASAILGAAILSGCGCSLLAPAAPPAPADLPPSVVVVPGDRWQYPMTNAQGVAGWFVPLAVHAEYCEAVALVEYYRSLHKPTPKGSPK